MTAMNTLFGGLLGPPGPPGGGNGAGAQEADDDEGTNVNGTVPPAVTAGLTNLFSTTPFAHRHVRLDKYGKPIPDPEPQPDLFPLSKAHWRNVPAVPEPSNLLITGGNIPLARLLKGQAFDAIKGMRKMQDRTGAATDDWAGWDEAHERASEELELEEHAILKHAFA